MTLFSLPNNSSRVARKVDPEQLDADALERPKFSSKTEYRAWCVNASTNHHFLSPVEGVAPGVRVTQANPPALRHGIVAEFDAEPPADWVERLKKCTVPPRFAGRTFSGHLRVWWTFEKPINIHLLGKLDATLLNLFFKEVKTLKIAPGFELAESSDPFRYYEAGTPWTSIGADLPATYVEGLLARAAAEMDWRTEAICVPVEKLAEEGAKRWPDRWPGGWGNFKVGARGPRFWDPAGDALSCIVVESGMVCFTGETPFVNWSSIFGSDWVRKSADDAIGASVQGIYYEANTGRFWRNGSACGWTAFNVGDIVRELGGRGLSSRKAKGEENSDIDRAILCLQKVRIVDGVFPAFFRPEEVVMVNQGRFLNTSRLTLLQPDVEGNPKGKGFPFIMDFLRKMFGDQLPYFLSWLAHFYRSCLAGRPVRGLSLFIAGPAGCGKTFLSSGILRQIFGRAGEASAFLLGEDQFNANLFSCPLWTVDDAIQSSDARATGKFGQVVKACTANDEVNMRGMYKEGIRMPWNGRIVVTLNDDAESLRLLPNLESFLLDKLLLLRASPTFTGDFPSDEELLSELPRFCAFLRDMPKDPAIWVGGRFGVTPFHHPELMASAVESQESTGVEQLLECWGKIHFSEAGPGAGEEFWRGNATELLEQLQRHDSIARITATTANNSRKLGRNLRQLLAREVGWLSFAITGRDRQKTYTITRGVL